MSTTSLLARPPTGPGSFARALLVVGRGISALARALAHRSDVTSMLELDDRMLKDIGLVRADVLGALAGPITDDPSTHLRRRSDHNQARHQFLEAYARRMPPG